MPQAKGKSRKAIAIGRKGTRIRGKARPVADRAPAVQGWRSSDAEEIERRRWRGPTDIVDVRACESAHPYFGSFQVRSSSGASYDVEIRSLDGFENSCGCADHRVNGLGTCKHVEGALVALRRRGVRAFTAAARVGSPQVEIYLSRAGDPAPRVLWPQAAPAARWW